MRNKRQANHESFTKFKMHALLRTDPSNFIGCRSPTADSTGSHIPWARWRFPWRIQAHCWFATSWSSDDSRSEGSGPKIYPCCPQRGTASVGSLSHSPCSCSSSRGTSAQSLEVLAPKPLLRPPVPSPACTRTRRWRDWWKEHPEIEMSLLCHCNLDYQEPDNFIHWQLRVNRFISTLSFDPPSTYLRHICQDP